MRRRVRLDHEFAREIHTRMPVILPEEATRCLVIGRSRKREILDPYPAERMKAWPIDARVNSPQNNDPDIIVPIELESIAQTETSPQLL